MTYQSLFGILFFGLLQACSSPKDSPSPIEGTWRLVSATSVTGTDSVITDYTKEISMIKVINATHFAFLKHQLSSPADSANRFDAGGGTYTLKDELYTEHLDYYSDRNWEGKTFEFKVSIYQDTLIQKGIEKVEEAGVDHEIIERYVRVKERNK